MKTAIALNNTIGANRMATAQVLTQPPLPRQPTIEDDDSPFCIDFTRLIGKGNKTLDKTSQTICDLIYLKSRLSDRVALAFDAEQVALTFQKCRTEMESLAAGLLAIGLNPGDRIAIAGANYSQVFISAIAASRAGLIFSLLNPMFSNGDTFQEVLNKGKFNALISFPVPKVTEYHYNLLLDICPGLKQSEKGNLKSDALPLLTHVILAEELYVHAGCFTLSEVYTKSSAEGIKRLPSPNNFDENAVACLQCSQGGSGEWKLCKLSHYQLLNGARAAVHAFKIKKEHILSCCLPIFRMPLFGLCALSPFLTECRTVFPEPSPLPRNLFQSIQKYQCSTLVSNGAALRLLLKMSIVNKSRLSSVQNIMLIGERVPQELLCTIKKQCVNCRIVAVGYLLSETGSIPLMADENCDFRKNVGKPIAGYAVDLVPVDDASLFHCGLSELRVSPFQGSKFLGYVPKPKAKTSLKWISTGDVCRRDFAGNVEIVCQKADLIHDIKGKVVPHWEVEKLFNHSELLKGCQLVCDKPGDPIVAVCVCKNQSSHLAFVKSELIKICNRNKVFIPDLFGFVDDFPRVGCRIQKWKIREMIRNKEVITF